MFNVDELMAVTNQSNQKVAKLDRIHPMLVGKLTGSKTRNRQKSVLKGFNFHETLFPSDLKYCI